MLGPRAVQHLQMPHPRDWQGGQMPRSCPGEGGWGWAQVELTDALALVLISKDALHIKGLNETSLPNFP